MQYVRPGFAYFMGAVLFLRVLHYSWVTDDAFITFRYVINFVSGDGPVFNIGERVQGFTHPLWFMLLSLGGFLDLNLYFFSIILGLIFTGLTIGALFFLNKKLNGDNYTALILTFGFLAASESFVSFATSGLENSLTYFLVLATIIMPQITSRRLPFYLLISLTLLNRFDTIFFLAPLFVLVSYTDWRKNFFRLKIFVVGALPLASWHLFSIVYYGFFFPNTRYAKIGGRPFLVNLESGLHYLFDSMQTDLHIWILVVLFPILMLFAKNSRLLTVNHSHILTALYAGIILHIIYVVLISGGDFMRGRFFTIVTLCASVGLLHFRFSARQFSNASTLVLCAGVLVVLAWIGATEHVWWKARLVVNERDAYKEYLALNLAPEMNYTNHRWALEARKHPASETGRLRMSGQIGYWIPRQVKVIDKIGLTDAFIARSPVINFRRTGHIKHYIPDEYLQIKIERRKITEWTNKDAQELYEKVKIVTESPTLFSFKRLKAMFWLWRHHGF